MLRYVMCASVIAWAGIGAAQDYPNKPVHIITGAPGGLVDLAARVIAQGLSVSLGQRVVVDNRGGIVSIAADLVAKAPPDGHTLLFYGRDLWILQYLKKNISYDPMNSFAPVLLAVRAPSILNVHPSLPVKSVKELIALARARPGQLNYASSGIGSSPHLATELFKALAHVDIAHVAYKGATTALPDLFAGRTQMMFMTVPTTGPYLKLGKVRALAITSAEPSALVPGLPTVAASGVPGYEAVAVFSLFAPAGTPVGIINRLNEESRRLLTRPEVTERFFNLGTEVVASLPAELAATIKSEMAMWGKILPQLRTGD